MSDDFDSVKARNFRHEIGGSQRTMTDEELRDKLASGVANNKYFTVPENYIDDIFKAGWDAARANDSYKLEAEHNAEIYHECAKERDQIAREYSTLKNDYFKLMGELTSEQDQLQWSLKKEQQLKEQLFEQVDANKELRAEVERLKFSRYEDGRKSFKMEREAAIFAERMACAERDRLKRQVEVMRKALEFYSNPENYEPYGNPYDNSHDAPDIPGEVFEDHGEIACNALAEIENLEKE